MRPGVSRPDTEARGRVGSNWSRRTATPRAAPSAGAGREHSLLRLSPPALPALPPLTGGPGPRWGRGGSGRAERVNAAVAETVGVGGEARRLARSTSLLGLRVHAMQPRERQRFYAACEREHPLSLCFRLPFSEREKSLPGTSGEVMREYFLPFS